MADKEESHNESHKINTPASRLFMNNARTKWLCVLTSLLYVVLFLFFFLALEIPSEKLEVVVKPDGEKQIDPVEKPHDVPPAPNKGSGSISGTHQALPSYMKIKAKDFLTNKEIYNQEKEKVNDIELSQNLWSRGLFGQTLSQEHFTCQIPIGKFDEMDLLKPKLFKKCKPVKHFSRIMENKYLFVTPTCERIPKQLQEETIKNYNMKLRAFCKEEIAKKLYPPKLTFAEEIKPYKEDVSFVDKFKTPLRIEGDHRRSKCPIVYVLKNQNTMEPFYHGKYITELPLKLSPDEQLITIVCGGIIKIRRQIKPVAIESHVRPSKVETYTNQEVEIPELPESISIDAWIKDMKSSKAMESSKVIPEKTETLNIEEDNEKKPNVVMLMMDGLSRVHFHRIFSSLVSYLQNKNLNTGYHTFEFFKYLSVDYSSNSNQTPMFFGVDWFQYCRHKWKCNFLDQVPISRSIWKRAQKVGYQTSFISQQCWMKYQADWMFSTDGWSHWFGLPLGNLRTCYENRSPICYSNRYSHEYVFDYSRKLFEMDPDVPKFVFHSFLDTHEKSMKVGSVLDEALTSYIHSIQTKHPDTWIILNSDHGIHYGNFFDKRMTGKLEHKLPLLLILAPPNTPKQQLEYLQYNQQRLVTHYDFYRFLEELLGTKPLSSEETVSLKSKDTIPERGSSFISTRFSEKRDCLTEKIQPYMCICNKKLNEVPRGWRACGSGSRNQLC